MQLVSTHTQTLFFWTVVDWFTAEVQQAGCAVLRGQGSGNAHSLVDFIEKATLSLFTSVTQVTFTFWLVYKIKLLA